MFSSSPVTYSYLSILLDNKVHVFAASLSQSYCSFATVILSSIVMINFYILTKRLFLKRKGLSDARVLSLTKKEFVF